MLELGSMIAGLTDLGIVAALSPHCSTKTVDIMAEECYILQNKLR
jgi:hypothetical protein